MNNSNIRARLIAHTLTSTCRWWWRRRRRHEKHEDDCCRFFLLRILSTAHNLIGRSHTWCMHSHSHSNSAPNPLTEIRSVHFNSFYFPLRFVIDVSESWNGYELVERWATNTPYILTEERRERSERRRRRQDKKEAISYQWRMKVAL